MGRRCCQTGNRHGLYQTIHTFLFIGATGRAGRNLLVKGWCPFRIGIVRRTWIHRALLPIAHSLYQLSEPWTSCQSPVSVLLHTAYTSLQLFAKTGIVGSVPSQIRTTFRFYNVFVQLIHNWLAYFRNKSQKYARVLN